MSSVVSQSKTITNDNPWQLKMSIGTPFLQPSQNFQWNTTTGINIANLCLSISSKCIRCPWPQSLCPTHVDTDRRLQSCCCQFRSTFQKNIMSQFILYETSHIVNIVNLTESDSTVSDLNLGNSDWERSLLIEV